MQILDIKREGKSLRSNRTLNIYKMTALELPVEEGLLQHDQKREWKPLLFGIKIDVEAFVTSPCQWNIFGTKESF